MASASVSAPAGTAAAQPRPAPRIAAYRRRRGSINIRYPRQMRMTSRPTALYGRPDYTAPSGAALSFFHHDSFEGVSNASESKPMLRLEAGQNRRRGVEQLAPA